MTQSGLTLASTRPPRKRKADRHWRTRFLHHLAQSSDVAGAAAIAGVDTDRVCQLRRADTEFARQWQDALAESYLHLEMELVRRLREGQFLAEDGQKFDFANAIRLLAAHRDGASGNHNPVHHVSAAEVRASIDRKIEDIRRRIAREKASEGRRE